MFGRIRTAIRSFGSSITTYFANNSGTPSVPAEWEYGARRTPEKRTNNVLKVISEIKSINDAEKLSAFESRYSNLCEEFYNNYKDPVGTIMTSVNNDSNPIYRIFIKPLDKLCFGRLSKKHAAETYMELETCCDMSKHHYDAQAILAAKVDLRKVERFLKDKRKEILQN